MRFVFTLVLFLSSGLAAAVSISDERWKSYCEKVDDPQKFDGCLRVDQVCEVSGFESERCDKARKVIIHQKMAPGRIDNNGR